MPGALLAGGDPLGALSRNDSWENSTSEDASPDAPGRLARQPGDSVRTAFTIQPRTHSTARPALRRRRTPTGEPDCLTC